MKRRIAAGTVALAVAIVVWRHAARSATSVPNARGSAAQIAAGKRKANPRAQAKATVTGRITSTGKPVAHARVCADTATSELGDAGRDAVCTESDANGAYELSDLYATSYHITANARGMRPADHKLQLEAGARTTVDLALPTGGVELAGTVTDIGGGPIAHAQIRAGGTITESDDSGAFSLWVDPGSIGLEATADGYAPGSWNGSAPDHAAVQLTPESSLSGTVVLPSGDPLADAKVEISGTDWRLPTIDTTSADDGTFHADRLAPGRYTITVRAAHAYGASEGSVLVALAEHTDGIIVSVVPAFQLTGSLTTSDGKPCTDGSLRLTDDDHARTLYTSGDSEGAIDLGGVLPGIYHVYASCSGFVSRDAGDIEIRNQDVSGKWTVEPGATVRGRVTMRDGKPAEGVEVRLQGAGWGTDTTAADGTYHIAGLGPGSYTVTAQSPKGIQTESVSIEVEERAIAERDVVLDPGATIKGVVVDARGTPVAGAYVHPRDVYGSATTNADGSFTLAPILPGDHDLAVELADRQLQKPNPLDPDNPEPLAHVSVEAGATATVRIVVDVESAEVRGVVVDGNGTPARDAVVELSSATSDSPTPMLTGDDGTFHFPAIRGARYRVRAYAAGRGEATSDAEAGEPIRLQLTSLELTGVVHGAAEELSITISGQMYRTETFFHTGGKFTIYDLRPGSYNVIFETPAGHAERTIEITDTTPPPLDIDLDPVFTLTGRVVAGDTHAPIANAMVVMRMGMQSLPDSGEPVQTDGAGRFTIKRAHAGSANIRVTIGDNTSWMTKDITGASLDDLVIDPPAPEVYSEESGEGYVGDD